MKKVNGIYFPNTAYNFPNITEDYSEAGEHIYKIALDMNLKGIHFPFWGSGYGFQFMTHMTANKTNHRVQCNSVNQKASPLEFKPDFHLSRLYGNMPFEIRHMLKWEDITKIRHSYCITEKNMIAYHLDKEWTVLSLNHDLNGLEYVSSIEHKR